MRIIYAVVKDLLAFAWSMVSVPSEKAVTPVLSSTTSEIEIPFHRSAEFSPVALDESRIGAPTMAYISTASARIFLRPVWALDTVVGTVSYGTVMSVASFSGRFAYVETTQVRGWVLKDELVEDKTEIWPQFVSHTTYGAAAKETNRLRQIIADEFFTRELFLPLTTEEFVWYRLKESGRAVVWGRERPRLAGRWGELLKGVRGVFMGVEPKTGSILEAYPDAQQPFLAYVIAVTPDNTIEIESVGQEKEGEYRKDTVAKTVWQAWRPIFIQIS